jgi:hypothetical protein
MDCSIIDLHTDYKVNTNNNSNNLKGKDFSLDIIDDPTENNLEFQFNMGPDKLNDSFQAIKTYNNDDNNNGGNDNIDFPIILTPVVGSGINPIKSD